MKKKINIIILTVFLIIAEISLFILWMNSIATKSFMKSGLENCLALIFVFGMMGTLIFVYQILKPPK